MPRKVVLYVLLSVVGVAGLSVAQAEKGKASFYHDKFQGRSTACGQAFNQKKLTAAHKKLPCGTKVKVTRRDTGKSVIVTVNDRGPFVAGRIIDLSKAAARKLGFVKRGIAPVRLTVLH